MNDRPGKGVRRIESMFERETLDLTGCGDGVFEKIYGDDGSVLLPSEDQRWRRDENLDTPTFKIFGEGDVNVF